jgi:hypothetical protein
LAERQGGFLVVSVHAYPRSAAAADLARATAGLVLAGLPMLLVHTAPAVTGLMALIVVVFVVYGFISIGRHLTRIEVDEVGIRARGPVATVLRWRDLKRVRLSYYSTRRDRSGGWLQLSLYDGRRRLQVDSRLAGFGDVAAGAAGAARTNGLRLEPATIANFEALGIPLGGSDGT